MNNIEEEIIEQDYVKITPLAHRKEHAQFFTPYKVAKLMCSWVYQNLPKKKSLKILEPAIGLGIFSRVLINEHKLSGKFTGYDIDQNVLGYGDSLFSKLNIKIVKEDYVLSDWNEKYDCIICNPPYFKFHDYDNTNLVKLTNEKTGSSLNGFTNLYALFIIKSIYQLEKDGCAAYIVPSEFLNSDYGKEVKKQLLKSEALVEIIVFDFDQNVFDDALTTSCILFIKKTNNKSINFQQITSLDQIDIYEKNIIKNSKNKDLIENYVYSYDEILPDIKWRNYYQNLNLDNLKNVVGMREFCSVKRGIATGANEYFIFNLEKSEKFGIPAANLLPCISKANDVKGIIFDEEDFNELSEANKNIYIVNLKKNQVESVKNYILYGENEKINERFLTKIRSPWYSLENKKIADLWVGVFSRTGAKFIWNKAMISNLTTFHGVYVKDDYRKYIPQMFAYLNTKIAKRIFEVNRREYGNGLNKMEPNDFNNSLIFNFSILTSKEIDYLNLLVEKIEKKNNLTTENALLEIEKFFESKILCE